MLTRQQRRWVARLHAASAAYRFRVYSVSRARIASVVGMEFQDAGAAVRVASGHAIYIASALPSLAWKDALLHEVAHVVADNRNQSRSDRSPHGTEWGRAYAMLYRKFYGTR